MDEKLHQIALALTQSEGPPHPPTPVQSLVQNSPMCKLITLYVGGRCAVLLPGFG